MATIKAVKITEAAKILGVSVNTLRLWEEKGILQPIRTPGGTRLYPLPVLQQLNPFLKSFEETPQLVNCRRTPGRKRPLKSVILQNLSQRSFFLTDKLNNLLPSKIFLVAFFGLAILMMVIYYSSLSQIKPQLASSKPLPNQPTATSISRTPQLLTDNGIQVSNQPTNAFLGVVIDSVEKPPSLSLVIPLTTLPSQTNTETKKASQTLNLDSFHDLKISRIILLNSELPEATKLPSQWGDAIKSLELTNDTSLQ